MASNKFNQIPKSVQDGIDDMIKKLNSTSLPHKIEQIGYWIWVSETQKPDKDFYKSLGLRWSSKKNMWFWSHPQSPKPRYYRKRKENSNTRSAKSKPANMPLQDFVNEHKSLPEKEQLEMEIESWENALNIDSGENHVNIRNEIINRQKRLEDLIAKENESTMDKDEVSQEDVLASLRDLFGR